MNAIFVFMVLAPQTIHMVVAPPAQRPRLALCRSRIRSEVRPASAEHEEGFGCGTVQRLHRRRRLAHSKKCSTPVRCADTRRHRSHSSEQQQFRCADTRRHSSHIHKKLGEVFRRCATCFYLLACFYLASTGSDSRPQSLTETVVYVHSPRNRVR